MSDASGHPTEVELERLRQRGRELSAEGVVLAGGGAAIFYQLLRPDVAAGVARHSDFTHNPLRRLEGTLNYVTAIVHGSDADRSWARQRVTAMHGPVHGQLDRHHRYDANDPDAQRWVAATLLVAAREALQRVYGAVNDDDQHALLIAFRDIGTELRMPADRWPASVTEFDSWWRASLNRANVTPEAREVFAKLQHPEGAPLWLRALLPLVTLVSLAMLPPKFRMQLKSGWNRRDRFMVEMFWTVAAPLYRLAPRYLRTFPLRRQLRVVAAQRLHAR